MTYDFFNGLTTACYLIATLFFIRFWRRTRKVIFAWFAAAFLVLGTQPALVWLFSLEQDQGAGLFIVRLIGFVLILTGIAAANVRARDD